MDRNKESLIQQLIDEMITHGIYKINDRHLFELTPVEIKSLHASIQKEQYL
ncbi:Fur-regulated basic protein FbpA [Shouchella patagoniensis]|uniref:Fur-regulated basic protein FbpA n=1 Tax=Shouchella patagoniensis TaxID=228576 RepID=UPI0009955ECC|nr:Fur-regulated basic protein FbpA [Shouchella patagoniensis]